MVDKPLAWFKFIELARLKAVRLGIEDPKPINRQNMGSVLRGQRQVTVLLFFLDAFKGQNIQP